MPPKVAVARAASPTPPPPAPPTNDAHDLLIIQDFMDTIDQIPVELTRVHSDLNELGAVLYSTLCNLERKLHQLIDWVQDPKIGPEQRFALLQDIAEEAARYKLGGDDKIRVAGGACDGIMAHQRHISELLAASTLQVQDPPSPYTQALTLPVVPAPVATRRGNRTTGSPFNDRGTPKRKKKKDATKDDDEVSSIGGKEEKKKTVPRKKKTNRGVSPSESVASNTYAKPAEPVARTARQIAAAAAKAKAALKAAEDSADDSEDDGRRSKAQKMEVSASTDSMAPSGALGVDLGSREGSTVKEKRRGRKRAREEGTEEDEDEGDDDDRTSTAKRPATKVTARASTVYDEVETQDGDATGGENEVDSRVYCTCRQVSYGEMIGCDDDECEIEWYHVACLNLDSAPEGNWICPQCIERRKRNPKPRKPAKGGKRK